jgi:hypothetical protein
MGSERRDVTRVGWGVIVASELTTQSVIDRGGVSFMVLKQLARDCWYHSPTRSRMSTVVVGFVVGAMGGMNEGPT